MRNKKFISHRLVHFKKWTNQKYGVFNSLKKCIKICTLALAYSIVNEPCKARAEGIDSTQIKTTEIDEVTVQASMLDIKSAAIGKQIEIISSAQLQNAPVSSLDELLRYVPNVEAQTRGAFGAQTDFSLRGANFNQMLVLIDGHKINDPLTGHFNSNLPITPSEIDRIEIIYGSTSSEYGPDAIGGVINIVTKTFSQAQFSNRVSINGKALYGQYNLFSASPGIIFENQKYALSAGSLINISDGNPLQSGLKNDFNNQTYSFSFAYNILPKVAFAYRYGYDYRNFNAQWYYTTSPRDSAQEKTIRHRHHLQFTRNSTKSKTTFSASFINTDDKYDFNSKVKFANLTNYLVSRLTHKLIFAEKYKVLFGAEIDQRSIESNTRGSHTHIHAGGFIIGSLQPIQRLYINPSFRVDYDERNKTYLIPQLSTSYKVIQSIILRASVGRSLRVPDFTELYYNNFASVTLPAGQRLGNPLLSPEIAWSYDFGSDISFLPNITYAFTLFYRDCNNQIDYVKVNSSDITDISNLMPDTTYWRASNILQTYTFGIENRLSFFIPISSNVSSKLILGYSYTDISSNSNAIPIYIKLRSKHLLNGSLNFDLYQLNISINSTYRVRESGQFASSINRNLKKSYAVFNASTRYAIFKNNLFATFEVYNLFDTDYSDFLGAEMPGRWIAGGVSFKF